MKRTPSSANTEPTDRSMPPVMMTKPSPIENRPNSPTRLAVLREVDRRQEARIEDGDHGGDHQDQDEEAEVLLEHCLSPISVLQCCAADGEPHHVLLAELRARSRKPLIRPSCITAMRSLTPITSSMSLEIIRMATPASASPRIIS